jgi:hypothetical protein
MLPAQGIRALANSSRRRLHRELDSLGKVTSTELTSCAVRALKKLGDISLLDESNPLQILT